MSTEPSTENGNDMSTEIETETFDDVRKDVRESILSILCTYPYVSRMMIQVSLGPACPPKLWRPILEELVKDGELLEQQENIVTPKGRNLTRVVYHPKTMPYPPIALSQALSLLD